MRIIFDSITVTKVEQSVEGDREVRIDMKQIFNSIVGMRNNIIHEDKTPNITSQTDFEL